MPIQHCEPPVPATHPTVIATFFAPLIPFLSQQSGYNCRTLLDQTWGESGVIRVLSESRSGCAFLQKCTMIATQVIDKSHYFETLKSKRRLKYISDLTNAFNHHHAQQALRNHPDARLHESLKSFHLYAGDGHFHAASCHDLKQTSRAGVPTKYPIAHLYALNLRNQQLTHLALGSDGIKKKPNDMEVLKRMETTLRQGATKGQKVLYVWDRAGIDFQQWDKWKYNDGIYFLSRQKSNTILSHPLPNTWQKNSPHNAGVLSDEMVSHSQGGMIRRITFISPDNGDTLAFLTNLPTSIPPGIVAHLYFKRWQIEKTFDEIKNKMHELKAWAASKTAKTMQANFIVLAHNLSTQLHAKLESSGELKQTKEIERKTKRIDKLKEKVVKENTTVLSPMRMRATMPLQKSVKFYRWLRHQIEHTACWVAAIAQLKAIYADF